jgi:hypothetical protein
MGHRRRLLSSVAVRCLSIDYNVSDIRTQEKLEGKERLHIMKQIWRK